MSTLKTYNLDSGDTTNLVIKTNGTTALTVNGSTQAITTAGAFTSGSTVADSTATLRPLVSDTAKASTSGTVVDFSSIPSWVKRITVIFSGVSSNSTGDLLIRLGTGGSFVATGYVSNASLVSSGAATQSATTSFVLTASALNATDAFSGMITLSNVTGNTWVEAGVLNRSGQGGAAMSAGTISLSGVLDSVRVLPSTGSFDAGTINIMYE